MRRGLRIAALLVALTASVWWVAAGMNRGWTTTSSPVKVVDDITGIEGVTYEERFVPGVEFLGVGLLGAGAMAGISFLFRHPKPMPHSS